MRNKSSFKKKNKTTKIIFMLITFIFDFIHKINMLKHSTSNKVPTRSNLYKDDLMSLSTITNKDFPPKQRLFNKPIDRSLYTNDI